MTRIILWARSLLFSIVFYLAVVLHGLLCMLVLPFLSLPKRFEFTILLNRFVMWWFSVACGVHYKIDGGENLPARGGAVLVCNHQSTWESFYLQTLVSPLCTVLKKELLRIPVFGWALAMIKPIAIDRSVRTGAIRQIIQQGKVKLQEGFWVLIFPEGTRLSYGERKKFSKTGAYLAKESEAPIIPLVHDAGACWPTKGFLKYPGTITVVIGPAIESRGKTVDEVHQETSQWMNGQLDKLMPETAG